ncbi:MAG TPA: hypothetical protein VMF62_01475 [Acetobacteraceae bacterium]|nr:hypothetical protein [Acetobacteraceae bacterium]
MKSTPEPGEITPASVRAVFRSVLRGSDRPPSLDGCREVAAWLQYLRLRRACADNSRSSPEREAARAAATLLAELGRLEKAYAKFPADIASVPALPFLEEALRAQAAIAADIRAARQALARLGPVLSPNPAGRAAWHEEAEGLYRVFLAAMREANPGRRYEPSNDGAAVRFIRAAFALAAGEERQEAAIAQALKRLRRKGTTRTTQLSRDIG